MLRTVRYAPILAVCLTLVAPDLRLGPETQDCVARVAPNDVVQDQGTGNLVIRR